MKKLLASFMLIVASVVGAQNTATITTLDPSQVYTTGNLVNNGTSPTPVTSTWQNVGLMNQGLPCWAPGDPGCGPQPYFNQGSFNFSYGVTDVYQIANIAAALPNSGTGLRINGYNFGFTAKNGNGWDGGGLDTLSAYVTFYGSDGKTVRYDYYDLNYVFNWTTFNLNKKFDTPYANKDLSNVRYGFVGGDTSNYWAGPYGPEIINVNFSLNYSVDPCFNNVLSSPSCPGYMDALAKLTAPPPAPEATSVSTSSTTPTSTVTVETVANPTSPTVTVTSTPSAPATTTTTTTTSTSSSTAATTQASSNNKESSSSSSSSLSLGLSVVAKNQQREQAIATQAVQTATSTAAAAATASQQEAAAVAAQAVANSTSSAATQGSGQQASSGTGIRASVSSQTLTVSSVAPTMQAPTTFSIMTGPMINSTSQTVSTQTAVVDTAIAPTNNMLLDKTNPLNQIIDAAPPMPSATSTAPSGSTVNRNASNNEAAGGVDLTKMAIAPTGYNSYLNFTLKDAAFYAPKEVYKNQRNVDNARAFRQLASDRVHQEMVEQQYRR